MANLVNLEAVTVSRGAKTLLDAVALGLDETDRVGVVGLNGAGKTTLLDVLTRREPPDAGRVTHRGGVRIGYLEQAVEFPPGATVRQVVLADAWLPAAFAAEHEWAGDAAVRGVLDGLGLPAIGLETPVAPLSGGERRRVALAALLVRETEVLVLDEPTNHLDVEGVAWLAGHLVRRRGALLVVTHDRWFLDAVCTRTWEVTGGRIEQYDGGYAAWVLARAERARQSAAVEARRQNLLRKELAWLRRGAPARTSKPRFRVDAANALIADQPEPRDRTGLRRLATSRLGRQVYDVTDVTVRYGERCILDRVTWRVGPGDRLGLVGVNGAGKTTLLRLLVGLQGPEAGTVTVGRTVRVAYLSQEVAEVPPTLRLLEAVEEVARRVRVGDRELSASQLAEMFGFSSGRQATPVGDLSGGERRRLQLLRLLMGEPNVLLLDEPTNDLDIDTLTALEDLLDSWPGTMIVVSHDRYLVERVCDTVYALPGDGSLLMLPGGVEEYLARRRTAARPATAEATARPATAEATARPVAAGAGAAPPTAGAGAPPSGVATTGSPGSAAGARQASSAAGARQAKKELARLERQIARLEAREVELHDALAVHATDYEKVTALDTELRAVRGEREATEERWLELSERT